MKYLSVLFLLVISNISIAQVTTYYPPSIQWQKCIGGTGIDEGFHVEQTIDGGYIVSGRTNSADGDMTGNTGNSFCLLKLDQGGNIMWQRFFPAIAQSDLKEEMHHTTDGGYIIGGDTLRKLDANGSTVWNVPLSCPLVKQAFDGEYFALCIDFGTGLTKIDAAGNLTWSENAYGIWDINAHYSIEQLQDSVFLFGGGAWWDVGPEFGSVQKKLVNGAMSEYFSYIMGSRINYIRRTLDSGIVSVLSQSTITKHSANAAQQWHYIHPNARHVYQHSDSSYLVSGGTQNQSNLTLLSSAGDSLWSGDYGGTSNDIFLAAQNTSDSGYIAAGTTLSNDGDVSGNHGGKDIWVVKFGSDSMAVLNINTLQVTNTISIFPNPTKNIFTITTPEDGTAEIYDMQGRLLYTAKVSNGKTDIKMPSNISAGTYLLTFSNADGNVVENKMLMYQP